MKLLKKDTDYAVRALMEAALAGKDKHISSSLIAKKQNIPLRFLRRILSKLISAKYLKAKEGVGGGVTLNKDSRKIKMLSLIKLFQGKIELSECMFRKQICQNRKTCPLRARILKIEDKMLRDFEKISIQNLLDDTKKGRKK